MVTYFNFHIPKQHPAEYRTDEVTDCMNCEENSRKYNLMWTVVNKFQITTTMVLMIENNKIKYILAYWILIFNIHQHYIFLW